VIGGEFSENTGKESASWHALSRLNYELEHYVFIRAGSKENPDIKMDWRLYLQAL